MRPAATFLVAALGLLARVVALPAEPSPAASNDAMEFFFGNFTPGTNGAPLTIGDKEVRSTPGAELFRRDDDYCDQFGALYYRADAETLQRNLQSINPWVLHYLPGGGFSFIGWTVGSVRVCVYNSYILENTHVSEWEVGWGVGYILGMCCRPGNPQW